MKWPTCSPTLKSFNKLTTVQKMTQTEENSGWIFTGSQKSWTESCLLWKILAWTFITFHGIELSLLVGRQVWISFDRKGELSSGCITITARFDAERLSSITLAWLMNFGTDPLLKVCSTLPTDTEVNSPARPDNVLSADVDGVARIRDMIMETRISRCHCSWICYS